MVVCFLVVGFCVVFYKVLLGVCDLIVFCFLVFVNECSGWLILLLVEYFVFFE